MQSVSLPDYIRLLGVTEFAKRFDITERAAISYMYRARVPKRSVAQRIVERSHLTWADIYEQRQDEVS